MACEEVKEICYHIVTRILESQHHCVSIPYSC